VAGTPVVTRNRDSTIAIALEIAKEGTGKRRAQALAPSLQWQAQGLRRE
jgi:hypothetical protein